MVEGGENRRMRSRSEPQKENFFVMRHFTSTKIIDPNNNDIGLTETMKKQCEGKTIFYNSAHVLVDGENFSNDSIASVSDQDTKLFKSFVPHKDTKALKNICPSARRRVRVLLLELF